MPKLLSNMRIPDPFAMNEDTVNLSVWELLKDKGFDCPAPLSGKQKGIDVEGERLSWNIYVESKGSHGNEHNRDTVFDEGQIKVRTYNQIGKLMEYQTLGNEKRLYFLANPDIPRIRSRVSKVVNSLDVLGFIRFWVQEDKSIKIEFPKNVEEDLRFLGYIKYLAFHNQICGGLLLCRKGRCKYGKMVSSNRWNNRFNRIVCSRKYGNGSYSIIRDDDTRLRNGLNGSCY